MSTMNLEVSFAVQPTRSLLESLLSLSRLIPYVRQGTKEWLTNGGPARLKQIERDLRSLSTYEGSAQGAQGAP
jgi:hypothetical protein